MTRDEAIAALIDLAHGDVPVNCPCCEHWPHSEGCTFSADFPDESERFNTICSIIDALSQPQPEYICPKCTLRHGGTGYPLGDF